TFASSKCHFRTLKAALSVYDMAGFVIHLVIRLTHLTRFFASKTRIPHQKAVFWHFRTTFPTGIRTENSRETGKNNSPISPPNRNTTKKTPYFQSVSSYKSCFCKRLHQ
ncbi:hypothetical protein, partial [Xylanibacter rodentium]